MKILVIEDEKILAQTIEKSLQQIGHEIELAFDGEEGLDRANSVKDINLILLDLMLPIKDGFTVLDELKQNEKTKNIPVIIMSNIAEEAKIKQGEDMGANGYLIKSNLSIEELSEIVNRFA
ncbi:TPA: response regulator [candidate division CPR2 bacterium]|uniref:DNA-binding response regulator VicR n=1 Tax=candidate division CPR2 bacterium GW2011_GWC1_41_48 TaxID=1618344 RepID=A0A0G0YHB3_UNCC2|nr:MAG: DNA-binding response regulator VicR [candidate division CPR2 bacterium GW2011_GWC2_39_35]KKR28887.1 MAG: DNA-binding response regulator VicR [candidate division CPR2 bacterium GW2011_GWD2_39_7]KKR29534.1 MAG: DNA-binding response regulator VicR [candidate division CPR2 bacterium GW2011_GWD1_39_7]KKS08956.1 MAG: DNA-binding response regulator VicR [candidate division CPR2 bacterium GW2011_GWC1_41_48]OGB55747.1 MAG: hypothetical protein A2Y27_01105 [candidate division CPR2 bacterium GWD1_